MTADVVISSNAVFTGLESQPGPASIAIAGNRIIAVGTEDEIAPFIGTQTRFYRFGDQLVLPGFHDFHLHVFLGSLSLDSVSLHDTVSEEEAARRVYEYALQRPKDPWVLGFGWHHVHWTKKELPQRFSLDPYFPDRPVLLLDAVGHGAWLNSKALELTGIDRHTPDPPGGEIARDEAGEPTGFLYENAIALARQAFELPRERRIRLLSRFLQQAAQYGVTSISDMLPITGYELGDLEMYREFEQAGKLTARIHFLTTLGEDLSRARQLREEYRSEVLQFSGLKQFLDGVVSNYTGYLLAPYADRPSTRGYTLIPADRIEEWTIKADREGFRIRYHACGDGAVRLGLDCFEAARRANGARDARHTIEHVEVIDPADIPRFAELNVIASMQPEHLALAEHFADNRFFDRLGPQRSASTWTIRSLQESGAAIALGSDFPIVDLNPMLEIYRAVTRVFNDGLPEGGWNPEEKISLADAIRAYTAGGAYGNFRERELGTLETGKLADLVVLDRNLFDISPTQIRETRVKLTMMDGQIVYEA